MASRSQESCPKGRESPLYPVPGMATAQPQGFCTQPWSRDLEQRGKAEPLPDPISEFPTGKAQAFINWAFFLVSTRKPLSAALRGFTAEQVKGSPRSRSPDKPQGLSHGLKEGNGELPASHTTVGRQDQS